MVKKHLKRLAIPKSWPLKRKESTFAIRPFPSGHKLENSIPVGIILRDILNYADTLKEVKNILNNEEILLNGKRIKDYKFPCGIFDIFEIKKINSKFILLLNKYGKFQLYPYNKDLIIMKIKSKNILRSNRYSIGLFNGYNILIDKKDFDKIKVKDSVLYDFNKKEIKEVLNFKENNYVYIYKGYYVGKIGKIKNISKNYGLSKDIVEIEQSGNSFKTAVDNCYVIPNDNDLIGVLN